jgi:hypothetical protein
MYQFGMRFWSSMTAMALSVLVSGMMYSPVSANPYAQRFMTQYNKIHNPANGYFSQEGVPYYTPETMIMDAPDYGHEATSETFSYYIWLEAMYGNISGNFSTVSTAWSAMETHAIPPDSLQPTNIYYNPGSTATFAPEWGEPDLYPACLNTAIPTGVDPLSADLKTTYSTSDIYGPNWLIDVDNWYGFGNQSDGTSRCSYINTYQRGPMESVWLTIPQPEWETFKWGGPNGYLDLFTTCTSPAPQWKYSDAPDADARAIQALYWAYTWARAAGMQLQVPVAKASKLGDYLRYCFFDKYFKKIGCQDSTDPAATGYQSAHYLLSWYYAWGGSITTSGGWAWRIGCSNIHFGYQNPVAAWALANTFAPLSTNGKGDWAVSLGRQLQLYQWLQSAEGAISGGCTNSWNGRYDVPPAGTPTFYGMSYQANPVSLNPPSNLWFGWQAWSMERVAEYFYLTNDPRAKAVLAPWIAWIKSCVSFPTDTTYQVPDSLEWTGAPATWDSASPQPNSNLHVTIHGYMNDIGVTASLSRALMYYSAALVQYSSPVDTAAEKMAQKLIDRMWSNYASDPRGVATPETRGDYTQLNTAVPLPLAGWHGVMPDGDSVKPGCTFLSIRSKYKSDSNYARVVADLANGTSPVFTYHRFWAQTEVALAQGTWATLFPNDTVPTVSIKMRAVPAFAPAPALLINNGMIRLSAGNTPCTFSLFACDGRRVFSHVYKGDAAIFERQFAPGAYVANLSSDRGVIRKAVVIGR